MHKRVKQFFENVKKNLPQYFENKDVLDCGSLDINGNNRFLFQRCRYTGIDIVDGRNVDVVTQVHEYDPDKQYDVVISSEMLEHDMSYRQSLQNMFALTKPGGLLLFTAAGTDRPEHGTTEHHPGDSPLTHNYYVNITVEMIVGSIDLEEFSSFTISYLQTDIRFAGVKR